MRKPDPAITGLDDDDRALLVEALTALRDRRGREWNAACDLAEAAGKRRPPLAPYRINAIVRLARRLGGDAPHWLDG